MKYQTNTITALEKITTTVYENADQVSCKIAKEIADLINKRADNNKNAVLGLATGSTPKGVYRELIRMHKEEGLSFRNVITFNLDEYYLMQSHKVQSYVRYMNEHLLSLRWA